MAGIQIDGTNQKLILDSDADTYLEAATDDTIKVYVSGAEDLRIGANAINVLSGTTLTIDSGATITNSGTANGFGSNEPSSADGQALGSASAEWSDLFLADGGIIKFGNDQDTLLTHTDGTGLTLNSTNKLCFNDASQYIQGASATVLDIAATDEIELTATEVEINVTTLDVNGNLDVSGTAYVPTLGVVSAKDLGTGIHIKVADSGGSVESNAEQLVIERNVNSGMTILSGANDTGNVYFGDSGDSDIGRLTYSHSGNFMAFTTNAAEAMRIDSIGAVTKPLQPAFHVQHGNLANKTGDGTQYVIVMSAENFDVNGDWSSATFTAPVTGKYFFAMTVHFENITGDKRTNMQINASNRALERWFQSDPESNAVDGAHLSGLVDMDASDTVQFRVTVYGVGADTVDLTDYSHYQGVLIA